MERRREVTGGVDLINHHKLKPQYDYFCKKSPPLSILESHYLHNVVGDTEIKTGDGMKLDQIIKDGSIERETNVRIRPFDIGVLGEAFQLRETGPIDLPHSEKGIPTIQGKPKDKDKKHKKHRDKGKDKELDKEHKKHKHRHKDRSKDKDKEKEKKNDKSGHHEKKRKHDGIEGANDIHKHKSSKH